MPSGVTLKFSLEMRWILKLYRNIYTGLNVAINLDSCTQNNKRSGSAFMHLLVACDNEEVKIALQLKLCPGISLRLLWATSASGARRFHPKGTASLLSAVTCRAWLSRIRAP